MASEKERRKKRQQQAKETQKPLDELIQDSVVLRQLIKDLIEQEKELALGINEEQVAVYLTLLQATFHTPYLEKYVDAIDDRLDHARMESAVGILTELYPDTDLMDWETWLLDLHYEEFPEAFEEELAFYQRVAAEENLAQRDRDYAQRSVKNLQKSHSAEAREARRQERKSKGVPF